MSTDPKKNDEIKEDELDKVSGGAGFTAAEGDVNSTESASVPPGGAGPSLIRPTPEEA